MEDPRVDIADVITALCTAPPSIQKQTIEKYFTPNAEFTHPFCRTGSSTNSRWLILQIYQWYKILSPKIEVTIDSVAYNEEKMLLYVNLHQVFAIWMLPFHRADVNLTTVLQLTHDPSTGQTPQNGGEKKKQEKAPMKYYIRSQNDLYQTSEFVKFVLPWAGVGYWSVYLWQTVATLNCVLLALLFRPFTRLLEARGNKEQYIETQEMTSGNVTDTEGGGMHCKQSTKLE